jgi:hypothetical protein
MDVSNQEGYLKMRMKIDSYSNNLKLIDDLNKIYK